jgi:protein-S-isoprenylcysteine O-methyltransferase Ste14
MDSLRYFIALITVIATPPGLLIWLAIHPLAPRWRRIGAFWTYTILGVPSGALMVWLFLRRHNLLAVDFGTRYSLIGLGLVSLGVGSAITLKRRKLLSYGILAGLPELSPRRYPGRLLTEGIYSRIRHPRYVETALWVLAYAAVANFLASWVVLALSLPILYLIVLLEERELRDRFGRRYEEYCAQVPRFIPRRRKTRGGARSFEPAKKAD